MIHIGVAHGGWDWDWDWEWQTARNPGNANAYVTFGMLLYSKVTFTRQCHTWPTLPLPHYHFWYSAPKGHRTKDGRPTTPHELDVRVCVKEPGAASGRGSLDVLHGKLHADQHCLLSKTSAKFFIVMTSAELTLCCNVQKIRHHVIILVWDNDVCERLGSQTLHAC